MSEPVGSVSEEMAKLMAALQSRFGDATAEQAAEHEAHSGDDQPAEDGERLESAECRWCPVCHGIRYARSLSPEVREHLGAAAVSMGLAVKALLDSAGDAGPDKSGDSPLEKISVVED